MESWSFPAVYDENYFRGREQPLLVSPRETMPRGARSADPRAAASGLHLRLRARAVLPAQMGRSRISSDPAEIAGGFRKQSSGRAEEGICARRRRAAPFGDYLCVPESEVFHIHGTSGTTGRPTAFAIGRNDWRTIANAHARVMWGMGLRPGDTICVAAIFSLYMGSWGALAGAERLGAGCFPFGAGVAGMSARCAQWLDMIKPTAFYGTPTYALHLAQVAADEGLDPRDFGLRSCSSPASPAHPSRRARQDRGALRRQGDRLRLDGGDVALDECRRVARRRACSAGRTSSTPRSAIPRP